MQIFKYKDKLTYGVAMRDFVKLCKALSDETRLRILSILLERECCVCEVMQALDISQTRASRNLAALCEAGFLKLRKDGRWSLYSINRDEMNEYLADLVQAVTKALKGNKTVERDRERLRKAVRVGPSCVEKMSEEKTTA
ncbi:MAG TPA: metalloregulator ArsR/SmtB family transcription factor [Dehalococcoidia bacterium]|jgi:ArsR family transcriptional regulator|nr:metalloregulator ArsR/SmtB family transcription factor [Dehalococcoidia bacterium]